MADARNRGHNVAHQNNMGDSVMTILSAVCVILAAFMSLSIHQVNQTDVGVYYRGGALLSSVSEPGYHLMIPFITQMRPIQITMQKDEVLNVPCGTSGGVMIYFDKIEVVNILHRDKVLDTVRAFTADYDKPLIFDKVHHELNQFCSAHSLQEVYVDKFDQIDEDLRKALQDELTKLAPGLTVMSVRVTKPIIPESIRSNYEKMEAEKTKLMIAIETQKVVEKQAETERKQAVIQAKKQAEVKKIEVDAKVIESEALRQMSAIEDDMNLAKAKSIVDAEFYKQIKESEANRQRLTKEYLELMRIRTLSLNTKIFFGPDIPTYFASLGTDPVFSNATQS